MTSYLHFKTDRQIDFFWIYDRIFWPIRILCGHASEFSTDLMFQDVQKRNQENELAHQLMLERPGISILFISGYFGEQDPGIRHPVLSKPFSMSDLLRKVAERLKGD